MKNHEGATSSLNWSDHIYSSDGKFLITCGSLLLALFSCFYSMTIYIFIFTAIFINNNK